MLAIINDLEGIVKLTIFKVSRSLWWKPHDSIGFGSGEVWTIIEKLDQTILELRRETLCTYDVKAAILNVVGFQFKMKIKEGKPKPILVETTCHYHFWFLRKLEIWCYANFTYDITAAILNVVNLQI